MTVDEGHLSTPLNRCCIDRILTLPRGWAGVTTYCWTCCNRLRLRDGEWTVAS